ncbi:TonB-dependent receptor plug domain-containing protein [Shewanella frigidimarina]|uniref:Ligand-gated channel protein n=1 Tax=Shewanella frigidimarina TaxID=56812 RepID=A0A106C0S5_SHEFR|nr:TonB-dependent receptor [Shewanella frigidimarina]KVX02145.1 ligand-gated channel protein [Shewanella frigidimarina]
MKLSPAILYLFMLISPWVAAEESLSDLDLDLDSLMAIDVQVTSAMKRTQSAFETASSIYVLTKEQITRSGVTSVPEALKMVPGLAVRQLDNNQWAISSRGVASRFSSKLLVMIDGQSLYTPEFAAVYWETLNVPLYDIERIEVIRGQGGLLWGSNATNGVINIITKNSIDTRGVHADVSSGSLLNVDTNLRYGGDIGNNGSFRVYGHVKDGQTSDKGFRMAPADFTEQQSAGARFDFTPNDQWSGLIQGDITQSTLGQNFHGVVDSSNRNISFTGSLDRTDARIMARLENRISPSANQMLQTSWLKQSGEQTYIQEEFESFDLDYQINFLYQDLQFDWGLNYRYSAISFAESTFIQSGGGFDNLQQYGTLAQAQYNVIADKLDFIVGVKVDHNDFTGWENQPLARLVWKPHNNQVVWLSASKSVLVPSLLMFNDKFIIDGQRVEEVSPITTGIPEIDRYHIRTYLNGNDKVKSEKSVSYEMGYRLSDTTWALDLSVYHTDTDNVAVIEIDPNLDQFIPVFTMLQAGQIDAAVQALTTTSINFDIVSNAGLTTEGGDVVLSWQPVDNFTAEVGYSYNTFNYDLVDNTFPAIGYDSTSRQLFTKADIHFFEQHNIFASLRVENSDAYRTDNYTALDITWNWAFQPNWAFAIMGKNLFAGSHLEYGNHGETYTQSTYIDESVTFKITAKF